MRPCDGYNKSSILPVKKSGMVILKSERRPDHNSHSTVTGGPFATGISGKNPRYKMVRTRLGQTVHRL